MSLVHGYLLPVLGVGSTEVLEGRWWEGGHSGDGGVGN
jgi:hypothetical protein